MKTKREKDMHFACNRYAQIFGLNSSQKDLLIAFVHRCYWAGKFDTMETFYKQSANKNEKDVYKPAKKKLKK